jgi:elongation factor P
MAITPGDFTTSSVFIRDGRLLKVVDFQHVKPGKGPAFVRTKMQDLRTGAIFEEKLRPEERFEEVRLEVKKYEYQYMDGDDLVCVDRETYIDQVQVPKTLLGKQIGLLVENEELTIAMNGAEPVSIELPLAVIREVTYTEPGVKGDTATGATKPATVEGGATVNVPLFVTTGDRIKVDTREFKYIERAK